jgi:hypothetical protein
MKAAGTDESAALVSIHARDLRLARQAADRVGQRPIDDRPHRAAVDVVAHSAVLRHVARAVVRMQARVCRATQCRHDLERECESAAPGPSMHVVPGQLAVQLHCHEPTAIESTSPATRRRRQLQSLRRVQRAPFYVLHEDA